MTEGQKNSATNVALRAPIPSPPKATTNPTAIKDWQNQCPLCSKSVPTVILAGTTRKLMKCHRCGAAYLYPRPSEQELVSFFSEEYISTDEDVEIRFGTGPERSLCRVADFIHGLRGRGRILDVGCAGGHFLGRYFHTSAWEKWGVELSKFAAGRAMRKEIHIQVGDIHSAALPASSFDVVTVLDTFYYFSEPRRELNVIRRILKPDGLLVLVLTCATSHVWRNTGWMGKLAGRTQDAFLESHHVFFYNPKAITSVLRGAGFRVFFLQPLPANDQGNSLRNAVASGYFALSSMAWYFSGARLMLGPRFLVAAVPAD
jgi:SAM-dependent methyltransferase